MATNNKHVRGFLNAALNNVFGPGGIHVQCKVKSGVQYGDTSNGTADTQANDMLETGYRHSCNRKNYMVTRDMSKREADCLKLTTFIIDGEFFIHTHKPFNNDAGISHQIIDADVCDIDYNVPILPGGGQIRMGVELDKWGAAVAYWMLTREPNDLQYGALPPDYRVRIPATEIRHCFVRDRPGQTRGTPLIAAAILSLRMMGMFEDAALLNAKIGASRNLFYTKEYPQGWTPQDGDLPSDNGEIIDNLREGEALELPRGVKPQMLDTRYPDGEIEKFTKVMMRGIAAALGTSYMTLTSDLSEANFSSLRAGLNEERSGWARLQQWFIENDSQPDYEDWLRWALAIQSVKLPAWKFDKYNACEYTGRRWPSVNPLQDNAADVMAINNLLTSPQRIIRSRGDDPDEIIAECKEFREKAEAAGIYVKDDPTLAAEVLKASMTETAAHNPKTTT
jgi:lambda family phage portal protein